MFASPRSLLMLAVKGILCVLVYVVATIVTGMLAAAIHFAIPNLTPPVVSQAQALVSFVLTSALLGLALTPLGCGTGGKRIPRWLALAFLPCVCMGLTAIIEILILTTMPTRQTAPPFVASCILPALSFGGSLAFLGTGETDSASFSQQVRNFFSAHSAAAWIWRLLLAILAFPVV